jgi:ubiquitin C-terminal hydrolase
MFTGKHRLFNHLTPLLGMEKTVIECPCRYQSVTYNPFLIVTLPCLKTITKALESDLSSENKIEYTCESCTKKTTKAVKKISYVLMPKVLILHLHRFKMVQSRKRGMVYEKDESFVKFPLVLDMTK